MDILVAFLICVLLFMVFPKSFKFFVGSWVGVAIGGFAWGLAVIANTSFFSGGAFVTFIVGGIVLGLILAARG